MNRTLVAALALAAGVCLGTGRMQAACVNDLPNSTVEPGEVCDDGNTDNDDDCNNACSSNNQCGNGVVDANKGEQCDRPANVCVGGTQNGSSCNSASSVAAMTSCYAGGLPGTAGCFPDGGGPLVCCSEAFRVATLPGNPACGGPFPAACAACPYAPACHGVTCTAICQDDASPDACRSSCRAAGCGDGVQDSGETCDDILRNDGSDDADDCPNGAITRAAAVACKVAQRCGDGFPRLIDSSATCQGTACTAPGTEECDAGGGTMVVGGVASPAPKRCRNDPLLTCTTDGECGTGPTATCGNADLPDHCRTTCRNPACGDGVLDAGESCDDGAGNTDTVPGACRTTCATAACGNEVLDAGEQCDAGNGDGAPAGDTPGDADGTNADFNNCTAACQCAFCGDGKVDTQSTNIPGACGSATNMAVEECDDGNANDNDGCLSTCVANACGDGFRNQTGDPPAELCDDDNIVADDGCSATCCNEVPDDVSSAVTQLANAECNNADLGHKLTDSAAVVALAKRTTGIQKRIADARGNVATNPNKACARIRGGLTKSLGLQRRIDREGLPAVLLTDLTRRRARVAGWLAAAGVKLGCKL